MPKFFELNIICHTTVFLAKISLYTKENVTYCSKYSIKDKFILSYILCDPLLVLDFCMSYFIEKL